jgi:poly-gamma-glutamate synthesis protein (capsule biosynthesis protein)
VVEGLTASANVTDARTVRRPVVLTIAVAVLGSTTAAAALPRYEGSVSRLDDELRAEMTGSSWRSGCPVPLRELRLVRITYVGFDAEAHRGRLVVHRRWASEMLEVFGRIYSRGFPIRRVRLVDRYEADDQASMRADNTSAFNCRYVAGTTTWSRHAYGAAIDVNPVENPYVSESHVSPPNGETYADRSKVRPGMIAARDVVWRAFRSIGWEWGGSWSEVQDYQHFSSDGR